MVHIWSCLTNILRTTIFRSALVWGLRTEKGCELEPVPQCVADKVVLPLPLIYLTYWVSKTAKPFVLSQQPGNHTKAAWPNWPMSVGYGMTKEKNKGN